MLGEISLKKPITKPEISVHLPNREEVGYLEHIHNCTHDLKLGALHTIKFTTPIHIQKYDKVYRNRQLDRIKERYHLKVTVDGNSDWYIINQIDESSDDSSDTVTVSAILLPHELSFRLLKGYTATSYNLSQVCNEVLDGTGWSLGNVDSALDQKYRSFDGFSGSILDFIFQLGETYDCVPFFDTENRKINFVLTDSIGENKGLSFLYGKYLKSMQRTSLPDDSVTRLYAYGRDGLTIHEVNPTGQGYIDDFSYYMYPFERDENRNVIQSSAYMSDELCHAILDYNELVASKENDFKNLLDQKSSLEADKNAKELDLFNLQTELKQIQDRVAVQQQNGKYHRETFKYDGTTTTKKFTLDDGDKNAVMIKISDTTGLTISLDDTEKQVASNAWMVLGKVSSTSTSVKISGDGTDIDVDILIMEIEEEDYTTQNNDTDILNKYNEDYKQAQVGAKQVEVDNLDSQIDDVESQINDLREQLAFSNNFTDELANELNRFIIEGEFSDENYINAQELYDDAKKKLDELKIPKENVTIDIVNPLAIYEESAQREWDKFKLGDIATIEHEILDLSYTAQLIEMSFDYENKEVSITIANLTNIKDNGSSRDKLKNLFKDANASAVIINENKVKWDKVNSHEESINKLLNEPYDAAEKAIKAGTNESVIIDNRGIRAIDKTVPDEYVIINHGFIGMTSDGGKTVDRGITTKGIVADKLYGQILISQDLHIENESGLFKFDKDGITIDGTSLRFTTPQRTEVFDPDNIIKEEPINTWASNDKISTIPATPEVLGDNEGINHTDNGDGTVNISFEWKFDGDGEAYDIDGFIIYLYSSTNSGEYFFGTDTKNEYNFVVNDSRRAIILYNLPKDNYYTFGVQAYRKVDRSITNEQILKSAIAKSKIDVENPYHPSSMDAYDGDIRATLTTNDLTSVDNRSVKVGQLYNGVQIDTNSGLVVTRSDDNVRSIFNATDGIKIQSKVNGVWTDKFGVDENGVIFANGLVIKGDDGDVMIDGDKKIIDFSKFTTIAGTIKADNIEAKSITADQIKDASITLETLHTLVKNMVNNFTKTEDINTGWSITSGTGTAFEGVSVIKNHTPVVAVQTSSDVEYSSDFVEVDPTKTYKITVSLYCYDTAGTRGFGVHAYDSNKQLIGVTEWDIASNTWGATTTTPYFWSQSGAIVDASGNYAWRDMEAYVLSSTIEDDGVPRGRNVDKHFKLPANAKYIRIFVSNTGNAGTTTKVSIWSPTMIEADSTIISFNQAQGGILKLGGVNNGDGQLLLLNSNGDTVVNLNANNLSFGTVRIGEIISDKVITVQETDITYWVNPLSGNDENDGLTQATAFKTIQRALDKLPKYNDGLMTINLVPGTYEFIEHYEIGGFMGRGQIVINYQGNGTTNKTVTQKGTIHIKSCFVNTIVKNGIISWEPSPIDSVNTAPLSATVYIEYSSGVLIDNFTVFARNTPDSQYGIYATYGSYAKINNCEVSNGYDSSIIVTDGSRLEVVNCTGSSSVYGIRVKGASQLGGTGTCPKGGSNTDIYVYQGGINNATFTGTSGSSTAPPSTGKTTKRWAAIDAGAWEPVYGWHDDKYPRQGTWSYGPRGRHKGFWFFPSDMWTTLNGKTIYTIKCYAKRRSEGGEDSTDVVTGFYYHGYATKADAQAAGTPVLNGANQNITFSWGEGKWFYLPSSWFTDFSNGFAKGIGIYTTNDSNKLYELFESIAYIEVVYSG